ncbi:MAG: ATP-binding protein [Thermoanaerobaculia bacterium]|nr:ATP-binding protein [Thermoanaerobaculia bacterium]
MALWDPLRRQWKDARFVVAGLIALLAALVAIFYSIQRGQDLPATLVRNKVLLFALQYLNVVLILAILFVLLRNAFKLLVERRNRMLGSKFKVKLVLTYFGLSLIPIVLLFVYATELLENTVDRWINAPLSGYFEQARTLVDTLNERIEADGLRAAREARAAILDLDLGDPAARIEVNRRLQTALGRFGVDYFGVFLGTDFVTGAVDPRSGLTDLPEPGGKYLAEVVAGNRTVWRVDLPAAPGRLVLAAALAPPDGTGRPLVVLAGTRVDAELYASGESVLAAAQGFRQLVVQREDVQRSHLLILVLITLLLLLASSWVGLYLARRITVPIQALAEGTRRVAEGDLGHRVDTAAEDELGVLIDSFNRMTAELERNRAELLDANRRLAAERALIAAVVDNVAAGVMALDGAGRIVTANDAALAMLRQRRHDVLGKTAAEAWGDPERSRLAELLAEPPTTGQGQEVHLLVGGDWKRLEVKTTPLELAAEPGGEATIGRVLVLEDLTELLKAQQLAAWTEAARRIAHEIKNPLTPIRLAAERLLQKHHRGDPDLGAALEGGVEIIVREVVTLQGMVDEFSRYARMPRPQPRRTDLGRLIEDILPLYRGLKPGVELGAEVGPGLEAALVDPEQIRRALLNLLDNAVEATDAPGRVVVEAHSHGHRLELRVRDTGRGIPAADKEKLFLPYFSTKGRGSGLGLAIVHRIVTDHQGTIRAEDAEPQGTVFTIELPGR